MLSSKYFVDLTITFRSLVHFELILAYFGIWCEVGVQLPSFASGYPVVPEPFVEGIVVFPLNGLGTLVKNQLTNPFLLQCHVPCGILVP